VCVPFAVPVIVAGRTEADVMDGIMRKLGPPSEVRAGEGKSSWMCMFVFPVSLYPNGVDSHYTDP